MRRVLSLKSPAFWALLACGCLAASCDDEGITSTCPPLPLYTTYPLGDAAPADAASGDAGSTQAAYAAAVDAGCATAQTRFPYDAAAAGQAGAAGETGSAGVGGDAASGAGGSSGDAGAAGAR